MAPPLVSHGFGGDGDDIFPRVPPHRAVARTIVADVVDAMLFWRRERGWQVTEIEGSEFAGSAGIRDCSMGGSASKRQTMQTLHEQSRAYLRIEEMAQVTMKARRLAGMLLGFHGL